MQPHTVDIRVRYAETDQMGVVYNAEFFVYFEVARTEFLRAQGIRYRDLEKEGIYLVVVETQCSYKGRALYDDMLRVQTVVERVRPTRIDFAHRVTRAGEDDLLAEGRVVLACLTSEGRPRRLPEQIRGILHEAE